MANKNGMQKMQRINMLLVAGSIVVALGVGEAVLRWFFAERLVIYEEERSLLYRYDPRLGWFPRENSTQLFTGSHPITVVHNSRGFRDVDHNPGAKPGLLFIGDSFVWGYDVEASDRFTEKLRIRLPDWDIYNLGVSGYSTDQELLLLMDQFDYYRPRIVVLIFCTYNDEMENALNSIGQGAYYKPYFDRSRNMQLQGIPVPTSLSYFARRHSLLVKSYLIRLLVQAFAPPLVTVANPTGMIFQRITEFVDQKGAVLVVGLVEPHGSLEYFLKAQGIRYLQLDGAERFTSNGWHWTPSGHSVVSERIYNYLTAEGLLASVSVRKQSKYE